jgi:hypothetical protein
MSSGSKESDTPREPLSTALDEPETPKEAPPAKRQRHADFFDKRENDTPMIASEAPTIASVQRNESYDSINSQVSSNGSYASFDHRLESLSPLPPLQPPPAPPSTPASQHSTFDWSKAPATPLPMLPVANAHYLEQLLLADGAATPAPTTTTSTKKPSNDAATTMPVDDFSSWAVGDRYELVRILGRGSYGEVAQAVDKQAGRPDAFVAIKRVLGPFEQQVDAIRLYREIHILRRMKQHACIIQLLGIIRPPTDDIKDFRDLYMIFECMLLSLSHSIVLKVLFVASKDGTVQCAREADTLCAPCLLPFFRR